jgi:hypothetical protein
VGVGSTGHSGDLPALDLGDGDSSLWGDAQDERLGSMEAPFPCRALGVPQSGSLQGLLVLPWKEKQRQLCQQGPWMKTTFFSLLRSSLW